MSCALEWIVNAGLGGGGSRRAPHAEAEREVGVPGRRADRVEEGIAGLVEEEEGDREGRGGVGGRGLGGADEESSRPGGGDGAGRGKKGFTASVALGSSAVSAEGDRERLVQSMESDVEVVVGVAVVRRRGTREEGRGEREDDG